MNHVQSATIVPEAKLVAACDLRDEFRAPIERMGAKFYTDYRRMLDTEKLDGVVVACPQSSSRARLRLSAWNEGCRCWSKSLSRAHLKTPTR